MFSAPPSHPARSRAQVSLLPALLSLVGLALLGVGTYAHLSVASRAHCDGCEPWHPLFVLAPLVVGVVIVGIAVAIFARQ